MFKLYYALLLVLLFTSIKSQTISGTVSDEATGEPLPNARLQLGQHSTTTNPFGLFEFTNVKEGEYIITVSANEYETKNILYTVKAQNESLKITLTHIENKSAEGITEVSLANLEEEDDSRSQNISPMLSASGDVFANTAGYNLSAGRFRIRGYDGNYFSVYINGILVNDAETGFASFSEWGGLNDVTRNKEVGIGLMPAGYSFGNIGGTTNIITRASKQRKQIKGSYAFSNRTYTHRAMLTYSTGLMENNVALTLSGSRRWGNRGYVEGTFYDGWAGFIAIEKKINDRHSIDLTMYASPTRSGQQASATQEAYDLLNNHYYNPNWGYQNGKVRNSRVKHFTEPNFILSHYFKADENTRLTTSLGFSMGENGSTALNWYDAPDPRPDYYRYLPSYQLTQEMKDVVAQYWTSDPNNHQINWDKLYYINYLSKLEGKQAKYFIEDRRNDHRQISASMNMSKRINELFSVESGVEVRNYKGMHFKVLDDLLGGNPIADIDQFAERDFPSDTNKMQNDMNNPNKKISEGDRFGYDYNIHLNSGTFWTVGKITTNYIDAFIGGSLIYTSFWREGNMMNGRYPNNSYGASPKNNYFNYLSKAGITYKITGRHFLQANAAYGTQAPDVKNAYVSPRVKDVMVSDLKEEKVTSGEISYLTRYPFLSARITAYHTIFENQTQLSSFYHDAYRTYVNLTLNGINKVHQGIELGLQLKPISELTLTLIGSMGNFRYTSQPTATMSFENGSQPDTSLLIYCKNFYVAGSPQTAASFGFNYRHPQNLFISANISYFGNNYLDFNPIRRTTEAVYMLTENDPKRTEITQQIKLKDGYMLDASIGKSFRMELNGKNVFFSLNFSVNNILDNKELITGGYEQLRFDFENKNVNKFPPKYFYAFGRTYFVNLSFRL